MLDAHVHLDFALEPGALERARDAGVSEFVVPGVVPEQWERAAELGHPMCVGVHPQRDVVLSAKELVSAATRFGAVGIGECGLDRRGPTSLEQQLSSLAEHVTAAEELELPLVLHIVRRHGDAFELLGSASRRGMVHAFVGSAEVAARWVKLGFHLSVGVMAVRSQKLREAIPTIPLDRLLLETDAPDGMPEPADLVVVLDAVAEVRAESREEIAEATERNARELFGL